MYMFWVVQNSINTKFAQANVCDMSDQTQAAQHGQGILPGQTGSLEKEIQAFHIINLQNLRGRVLNGGVTHPHNLC